jgi:peptide/nickel transport system substrate-binding protein
MNGRLAALAGAPFFIKKNMIRKLRWPILITLLALVVIAALLLGQQPDLVPIVPAIEPATGGIYAEGLIGSMVRLNPLLDYYHAVDRDVDRLLFSGLLRFDDRGFPIADLADSWGISQDGTVYNFSIRQAANWHDGEPVTSDDVIFTLERMQEEGSPLPDDLRSLWQQVEVRRLDEKTLQFRLPEPFSPFLDYLTFGVVPQHLLGDLSLAQIIDAPFNLQPVGSGPYQFEQLIVEDGQIVGVALRAFDGYYGSPPFIEQFNFRYYTDAASALQAYRDGDILGISQVPADILPEVLAEPELDLHTGRLPNLTIVFFNLDDPQIKFLQDVSVRKALLAGLNRQRIIDRLLGGQAIQADSPIFPGTWAAYEDVAHIDYDPDLALKMLRDAGYTIPAEGGSVRQNDEGLALSFEIIFDSETHSEIALAIKEDWARLGVEVNLRPLTYADLITALDSRLYQSALVDLNLSRYPDPDPYPFWHQAQVTGGQNYARWNDRQASEYLEQARVTTDLAERTRLYRNFQVRFSQELPALLLYYPVYRYAVDQEVQGIRMGPLFDLSDRFNLVNTWFLVTRRTTGQQPSPTP